MCMLLVFGENSVIFGQKCEQPCCCSDKFNAYQETFDLYPNKLDSDRVFLTGAVTYTPAFDNYGNKYFYSIDNVATWLTGEDAVCYSWVPSYWEWYVSDDSRCVSIDVHGTLYEPFLWWTLKHNICKRFTYAF